MILEQERYFTPRKFLNTGREMFVEMRGSLHTKRGKAGAILFLMGILWGISVQGTDLDPMTTIAPLLWSVIGMTMFLNLENHKLLYMLPISRKEFAAAQIRKTAWIFPVILAMATFYFACADGQNMDAFWRDILWKAVPGSASLSAAQIVSRKPLRESKELGKEIYKFSYSVLIPLFAIGLFNLTITASSWSAVDRILPVMNYGINIYAVRYLYRKMAFTELYYDEL